MIVANDRLNRNHRSVSAMSRHTELLTAESVRTRACQVLDGLLSPSPRSASLFTALSEIHRLLEALPLGTAEFGLAVNRISNAQSYLRSGEPGAARFELRLLRGSLER
jgi:hypothetical protein